MKLILESCIDCGFRLIVPDPDTENGIYEIALLCSQLPPDKYDVGYFSTDEPFPNRLVKASCDPRYLREETPIPDWCPFKK